jgi:hypothetical protein
MYIDVPEFSEILYRILYTQSVLWQGWKTACRLRCVPASSVSSVCFTCVPYRPSPLIHNVLRDGHRLGVPYIEKPARVKSLVRTECGPLVSFVVRTRSPSSCTCRKEVMIWKWFLRNLSACCATYVGTDIRKCEIHNARKFSIVIFHVVAEVRTRLKQHKP